MPPRRCALPQHTPSAEPRYADTQLSGYLLTRLALPWPSRRLTHNRVVAYIIRGRVGHTSLNPALPSRLPSSLREVHRHGGEQDLLPVRPQREVSIWRQVPFRPCRELSQETEGAPPAVIIAQYIGAAQLWLYAARLRRKAAKSSAMPSATLQTTSRRSSPCTPPIPTTPRRRSWTSSTN